MKIADGRVELVLRHPVGRLLVDPTRIDFGGRGERGRGGRALHVLRLRRFRRGLLYHSIALLDRLDGDLDDAARAGRHLLLAAAAVAVELASGLCRPIALGRFRDDRPGRRHLLRARLDHPNRLLPFAFRFVAHFAPAAVAHHH